MKSLFYWNTLKYRLIKRFVALVALFSVCMLLFFWIAGMRDIIDKYALNKLEYLVTDIIDESIYTCFETHRYDFESLIVINEDASGRINSISIEPYSANMLKSRISREIVRRVNYISNDDLDITLGMLLGHFGLGSWGPKLPLTVSPNGNVSIDFKNSFDACGINQVMDSVSIDIDVDISAMMPFYRFNSTIHSSVIISQTVIVGDVPNTYLNIGEHKNDG